MIYDVHEYVSTYIVIIITILRLHTVWPSRQGITLLKERKLIIMDGTDIIKGEENLGIIIPQIIGAGCILVQE